MELPANNTWNYYIDRKDVAQYVYDRLGSLEIDSAWTMTIRQDLLGDFYVTTVIDGSSGGIGTRTFYSGPLNTSANTPGG